MLWFPNERVREKKSFPEISLLLTHIKKQQLCQKESEAGIGNDLNYFFLIPTYHEIVCDKSNYSRRSEWESRPTNFQRRNACYN